MPTQMSAGGNRVHVCLRICILWERWCMHIYLHVCAFCEISRWNGGHYQYNT